MSFRFCPTDWSSENGFGSVLDRLAKYVRADMQGKIHRRTIAVIVVRCAAAISYARYDRSAVVHPSVFVAPRRAEPRKAQNN